MAEESADSAVCMHAQCTPESILVLSVNVEMRSVVHVDMQAVHSMQLTWLRNRVLQMHKQASKQGA